MNVKELGKAIAEKAEMTQKEVAVVLNAMAEVVSETIGEEEVKLMNGLTVYTKDVEACTRRNPSTNEPVEVPAHKKVAVKIGTTLKNAVNA